MQPLFKYCCRLADNSLILSHRLAEYSSRGPYLEEDLAISNVALDHLGQADFMLDYAAEVENKGRTADDLAYKRPEHEYFNCQLVEQPNGNFAEVTARQFFIDVYNFYLYSALKSSNDSKIAAIADKSLKEVSYHLRRSSEWIIRLGDGTKKSHRKMQDAVNSYWKYTGELFEVEDGENELIKNKVAADMTTIKSQWDAKVDEIFRLAKLNRPSNNYMATGSRKGIHTEYMGHLLAEMQYLQRAYPDATW